MSKAVKAALLSGLLIPGAGQLYLKRKRRGAMLIIIVLAAITIAVLEAGKQANRVLEQLQAEGGIVTTERIMALASQQASSSLVTVASFLLVASWLFAVIDAYRLGKQTDQHPQQP